MKVCVITPVPNLEQFAVQGDAHLLLTHLVQPDNSYTRFYAGRKELKILDNGLFENHVATPTPEILAKAKLVGADVLIAPDVLYDPVGTVANAREFKVAVDLENGIRRGRGLRPLQMMAVPQATNRKDYLWCYKQLVDLGFSWIGLSILACPKSFMERGELHEVGFSRVEAYRALKETGLWNDKVNHHLLGLGSLIHELEFFSPISSVVSNDSSSPILHATFGLTYINGEVPGGKRKEKMDFATSIDPKVHELVNTNIAVWKQMASFHPKI